MAGKPSLQEMQTMNFDLPFIAGAASSAIFVMSTLPMLLKAFSTKNLTSYSLTNIMLSNIGNLIYAIYVYSLPVGPVWALHTFNLAATGLMLFWYLRYEGRSRSRMQPAERAACACT
jgi:uncharacterized protein with PQ loop repeat